MIRQRQTRWRNRCRGVTLIELVVGMIVGGSVLAMLYYIFTLTNNYAQQQSLEAQAVIEAQAIADQVDAILHAVQDAAVFSGDYTSPLKISFESDRIEAYAAQHFDTDGFSAVKIQNQPAENGGTFVAIASAPLGAEENQPEWRKAGTSSDLFDSKIEFQYADQIGPDLKPVLAAEHSATAHPLYIRYRIEVRNRNNPDARPFVIHSGVAQR